MGRALTEGSDGAALGISSYATPVRVAVSSRRRPLVPRFPPLEAFERRPTAASEPSRTGRHPKPFTGAGISGAWRGFVPNDPTASGHSLRPSRAAEKSLFLHNCALGRFTGRERQDERADHSREHGARDDADLGRVLKFRRNRQQADEQARGEPDPAPKRRAVDLRPCELLCFTTDTAIVPAGPSGTALTL